MPCLTAALAPVMPVLRWGWGGWGRRMVAAVVVGLFTASSGATQTAPSTTATLDLEGALRMAAVSSPLVTQADAQLGMARGELRAQGQWLNPVLEYRRENLGAPLLPDEFFTAFIPFDLTGRRTLLLRATGRGARRFDLLRAAARQDALLTVADRWIAAAQTREAAAVLAEQATAVAEIARRESIRATEGAVGDAVALRTRVEADRLALLQLHAEVRAEEARRALATALGVEPERLPALPRLQLAQVSAVMLGALERAGTGNALLQYAVRERAEVRAAEVARDEAALRRRVEQVGVLGDWQLQGGTKLTGGFMTGQIGLAVPLPMFNHNSGGRERAREAERDADAAYRTAMLQVVAEAAVAEQQRQRLEALRDRFSDASYGRVIAESARIAYAEGAMTLLELLDAERAAADAQLLSQQYAADALRAQLVLARAVGISLVSMSSGALGALP